MITLFLILAFIACAAELDLAIRERRLAALRARPRS